MRAVDAGGGDGRGVGGSDGRQRWMADADGMAEGKAEKRGGWRRVDMYSCREVHEPRVHGV